MSRKTSGSRASFSPTQRKACAVLAVCVLAVILTFIASWVLPGKLSLGGSGRYDPQAYPLDTSLGSVLAKTSDAGTDYVSSTRPAGGIQNETPPRGHAAGQQRSGRQPFL